MPGRRAHHDTAVAAPIVLGVLAVAALLVVSQLLAGPSYVKRLTFQNSTPYQLMVEASDGRGDGWINLGTIDRNGSTDFGDVYDVGSTWRFRVWAQGKSAGTFRVSRDRLEQSGWRVQIPRQIGDQLVADGIARQP